MLKKIALTALFAITFSIGLGAATASAKSAKTDSSSDPQGFCPLCGIC